MRNIAWTAPRTWATAEVVTASIMNTHVRDNLNILVPQGATVATSQTTTSLTFTDLATSGPAVTITTGTKAIVIVGCEFTSDTAGDGAAMSYGVTGATTIAAADSKAVHLNRVDAGDNYQYSYADYTASLTAGSNTFTAKYRAVTGGTATFVDRRIIVINVP